MLYVTVDSLNTPQQPNIKLKKVKSSDLNN